jgi:regulator of protease activity HflC (stomatin/prohibitin superfamily)
MRALDWLGDIASWLLTLVPRLHNIRRTHGAVKFTRGRATVLKPGVVFYWPLLSEIQQICVVRQTLNLPYQCLISSDSVGVTVAVTVVYEISDTLLALTSTDNIVDTIHDLSQFAIKRAVSACSSEELRKGVTSKGRSIDKILRLKLSKDLSEYGVAVKQAFISEYSTPRMIRLMTETASN